MKAIIYDLDDVMVDSCPLHDRTDNALLREFGIDVESMEVPARWMGMRVIEVLREIYDMQEIPMPFEEFYALRQQRFIELCKEELQPMPGLHKSLERLRGYKLAIASSGARDYIEMVLEKFGLKDTFTVVITGDDVTRGKPDPQVYSIACQRLGLMPEECVVLEDATSGIIAAKAAGCKCIAVENPGTPKQDLSGADIIVRSLDEVTMPLIERLRE